MHQRADLDGVDEDLDDLPDLGDVSSTDSAHSSDNDDASEKKIPHLEQGDVPLWSYHAYNRADGGGVRMKKALPARVLRVRPHSLEGSGRGGGAGQGTRDAIQAACHGDDCAGTSQRAWIHLARRAEPERPAGIDPSHVYLWALGCWGPVQTARRSGGTFVCRRCHRRVRKPYCRNRGQSRTDTFTKRTCNQCAQLIFER